MSKKRTADGPQLNKDNAYTGEEDDAYVETGDHQLQMASPEELSKRTILKATRRHGTGSASATTTSTAPTFTFAPTTPSATTTAAASTTTTTTAATTTPAALPNWASKFSGPPGSWECPSCEVRNKPDVAKCAACQTQKPGGAAAAPSSTESTSKTSSSSTPSLFSFGAPSTSSASSASSSSSSSSSTAPSSTTGSLFTFGTGNSTSTFAFGSSSNGFVFGSASTTPPFSFASFGSLSTSAAPSFSFGSSEDSSAESFRPQDSLSGGDINAEFKGKKAEATGEENDNVVLQIQCKAFVWKLQDAKTAAEADAAKGNGAAETEKSNSEEKSDAKAASKSAWTLLGTGDLHINTYSAEVNGEKKTKARVILRADKTHRLILNAGLLATLEDSIKIAADGKHVNFISVTAENTPATYLLRLKNPDDAAEVHKALKTAVAATK